MKTIFKIAKTLALTLALATLTAQFVMTILTPGLLLWILYFLLSWYIIGKAAKFWKIYIRHYNNKQNEKHS